MGRRPCCEKVGLNRGGWNASEDQMLMAYIKANGEGKWRDLPKKAGLKRCGKSCRFRWMNYLNPKIRRGNITPEEEYIIVTLQKNVGNRWSLIASRLPGRTDNEIKNYWNTTLCKKIQGHHQLRKRKPRKKSKDQKKSKDIPAPFPPPTASMQNLGPSQGNSTEFVDEAILNIIDTQPPQCLDGAMTDLEPGENCVQDVDDYLRFLLNDDINTLSWDEDIYDSHNIPSEVAFSEDECLSDYWREIFESGSLATLSESQQWA